MQTKMMKGVLVLLLAAAPVVVGVGETLLREFPDKEPFFGQPVNLLSDVIIPSAIIPAIALGVVGYSATLIPMSKRFRAWSLSAKLGTMAVLNLLMIVVLWLGIMWAYWGVILAYHSYWDLLFAPSIAPRLWIFIAGLVWTASIIFVTLYLARKAISSSGEIAG